MPRLPTILVIGSQAISTRPVSLAVVIARASHAQGAAACSRWRRRRSVSPGLRVARQQVIALLAPLRLLVRGPGGEAAQSADHRAVQGAGGGRHLGPRRLVHEWHELVGEPRHGAGDPDAADVRAAADAVDPAVFW